MLECAGPVVLASVPSINIKQFELEQDTGLLQMGELLMFVVEESP
jgi:hypothetical protein